jgi:phosphorylcholine metabolism protein LicD
MVKISQLIFIVVIIIIIYIFFNAQEYFNPNLKKFKMTDEKIIKKVIEGLEIIDKIFRKHNIYYSISFGTLLGAIRHGQMIPWDDDVDLLIWRKDIDKIMSLNEEFKQNGWILEIDWKLIKLYPIINDKKEEYPFIDFFVIDEYEENNTKKIARCLVKDYYKDRCEQLDKKHKWYHKWFHFNKNLIDRLTYYNLESEKYKYSILTKGPKDGIKILKYWYGDDCLKVCKTPEYNHITSKYEKPISINCDELKSLFE